MQIELIVESMLLPRLPDGQRLELPDGGNRRRRRRRHGAAGTHRLPARRRRS